MSEDIVGHHNSVGWGGGALPVSRVHVYCEASHSALESSSQQQMAMSVAWRLSNNPALVI